MRLTSLTSVTARHPAGLLHRLWLRVRIFAAAGLGATAAGLLAFAGATGTMAQKSDPFAALRAEMVDTVATMLDEIDDRIDPPPRYGRVLEAMARVPRHAFVPASHERQAYRNRPLPIGQGQTISQPLIVALMTALADVGKGGKVLEIGTGSGYQAAVLAEMGVEVYSIEIVRPLGETAAKALAAAGYDGVHLRIGDGYAGWPENAPFDAVIVTAAPDHIPAALVEQLRTGGRMVIPVGRAVQDLMVLTKQPDGTTRNEAVIPVQFVPFTRQEDDGG